MTEYAVPGTGPMPAAEDILESGHRPPGRAAELAMRLQERADHLRSLQPEELRAELEDGIRARPILSVALAAAAGFLLGRLLRR